MNVLGRGAWATAIACALVLGTGSSAESSPLDLFGFGGRSPGMAGTGVASATGFDAAYLNPAGLADNPHKRLTFGYMYGTFALELDGQDTNTEDAQGLVFGGAMPIPMGGVMKDRVGFGIGFHVPPNAVNRARHPFPGEPVFELLETRSQVVGIQASFGFKIKPWLRLGIGTQSLATLEGAIHVSTDSAGRFTTRSEQQLVTKFAPLIGARVLWPGKKMQFGAVLRGESRTDYQLLVTNSLAESLPLTIPTLTIGGTSQFDPLTVAAEVAWEARNDLVVNAQLAWQNWSHYPLPTVNAVAAQPDQEPPAFHDTFVPRVSAQWTARRTRATALVLRGGYFFVPSPAPTMDGRQSLLDNNRHAFTLGAGAYFPGTAAPVYVDVWSQVHVLSQRSHTKDPANFMPDETLPFTTISSKGRILVGGLTFGVDI
jgi:long-chain fatty acid transport protein